MSFENPSYLTVNFSTRLHLYLSGFPSALAPISSACPIFPILLYRVFSPWMQYANFSNHICPKHVSAIFTINYSVPCPLSGYPFLTRIPSPDRDSFIIFSSQNTRIPAHKLTTKRVYLELQQLAEVPTRRFQKWNSVIRDIQWRSVWHHCYDSFSENKFCDTHWRMLHRSLPLAPGLYKRNRSPTPYCSLCSHNQNETLTHLFFECEAVQPLLCQTEQFITRIKGSPFTLNLKHIVTNLPITRNDTLTRICNYLLNVTRYTIWTVRNIQRYEQRVVNLQNFARLLIKERLNIEHFISLHQYNDLDSFSRSWASNSVLCALDNTNLVHLL